MEREMVIGEMAALVHATEKKRGDNENNKVIHSESYLGVEVILVVALERHVWSWLKNIIIGFWRKWLFEI